MSKINGFVESLIKSTEVGNIQWTIEEAHRSEYISEQFLNDDDEFIYSDLFGNKVCLIKFGGIQERVKIILFSKTLDDRKPASVIEEDDVDKSHRLWTLYKLAERNATGADKIIEDIISKLNDDLPFEF